MSEHQLLARLNYLQDSKTALTESYNLSSDPVIKDGLNAIILIVDEEIASIQAKLLELNINPSGILHPDSISYLVAEMDSVEQAVLAGNTVLGSIQTELGTTNLNGGSTNEILEEINEVLGDPISGGGLIGAVNDVTAEVAESTAELGFIRSNTADTVTAVGLTTAEVTKVDGKLTATNSKLDTLDGSVDLVKGAVDIVNTSVGAVDTKVGTVNSNLTTLHGKVDLVTAEVAKVDIKVGTTNTNLGLIKTAVEAVDAAVDLATAEVAKVDLKLVTTNTALGDANNGILGKLTLIEADTDATRASAASADGKLSNVVTNTGNAATYTSNLKDVVGAVTDTTAQNTLLGRLSKIEEDTGDLGTIKDSLGVTEADGIWSVLKTSGASLGSIKTSTDNLANIKTSTDNLATIKDSLGATDAAGIWAQVKDSAIKLNNLEIAIGNESTATSLIGKLHLIKAATDDVVIAVESAKELGNEDRFLASSKGDIVGEAPITIYGRNTSVNNSGVKAIAPDGAAYFTDSQYIASVISFHMDDDITESGAHKILIEGLTSDYVEDNEVIDLGGETAVYSSKYFMRINKATVIETGGTEYNVGQIDLSLNGNKATAIEATCGINSSAVYTVPAGKTAYLLSWGASTNAASATTVNIRLNKRTNTSLRYVLQQYSINSGQSFYYKYEAPLSIPEKTDIYVTAIASDTTNVSAHFTIILKNNS